MSKVMSPRRFAWVVLLLTAGLTLLNVALVVWDAVSAHPAATAASKVGLMLLGALVGFLWGRVYGAREATAPGRPTGDPVRDCPVCGAGVDAMRPEDYGWGVLLEPCGHKASKDWAAVAIRAWAKGGA